MYLTANFMYSKRPLWRIWLCYPILDKLMKLCF